VTRVSCDVWTMLEEGRVHGEALWARRAAPGDTDRLLAALDADGRRHYLIALDEGEPGITDRHSRGIQAVTQTLAGRGHLPGRYIDVTCQDAAGHAAFQLVGDDLASRLVHGNEAPAELVRRVLAKWRRFWSRQPQAMLSRAEQLGMFAEVWFLVHWLIPTAGPADAVRRWRGPSGARHDFEWPGRAIEVKATTSSRGPIHRINGIDQLAAPPDGDLILFSLQMREEASANHTLPRLVQSCIEALKGDDEALSLFDARLVQLGYSQLREQEYEEVRLRVAEEGLFVVRDDFPRLTSEEFEAGLPPGVEALDYEINLSGFTHLRIAQAPAGFNVCRDQPPSEAV